MDVQSRLDDIVAAVRSARSMPMSASCVVNRAELLALLEEVREALPGSLAQARELLGGREQMVAEAQDEARRIIEAAHSERGSMVSGTEVARRSQLEAERILAEARREAEAIRAEADDYVDSKLANFEVVLSKTVDSVGRGKDKLLGRAPGADGPADGDGSDGPDGLAAPERPADPAELRDRADAYVEAQFQAIEAVLTKTLDAVGRGRKKLTGHRPMDDLAAHLAAQDEAGGEGHHQVHVSDADYLAGLAEPRPTAAPQGHAPQAPGVVPGAVPPEHGAVPPPAVAPPEPAADPYAPAAAYDQQGYPVAYAQQADAYGQGGYGYPPQQEPFPPDPYARQDGYAQQDPYAAQRDAYAHGYPQQPYPDAYAQDGTYAGQSGYPQQPQAQQQQQAPALDETSFFDTSMIDMEQLRRYEEGR
ncbi:hypothetical protein GCM10023347_01380 [Streptomyces chumphonensis]|uniref:Cell division initiation protein n=1 Tax=Streptomyces chumphonensis TaxID=1214925 RepID=A0A927F3N1_9ACTN|nr:cell division initiation protein [Streptomyces chumphonensis]MBD3934643.1 cell division initiation protein [Streptomyces chumphonensis]